MRLIPLVAVAAAVLAVGCAAPADQAKNTNASTNANTSTPGATTAPPAAAPDPVAPTAQPMGKIGADQVSKVSPVPAFKSFGEHWSIDIQATGEMNHKVDLTWGSGGEKASGNARYNGQPADAPGSLIVLSGELNTAQGAKPMTIEIKTGECIDDGDNKHMHSVQVHVDGMDALTGGCGDLAMY